MLPLLAQLPYKEFPLFRPATSIPIFVFAASISQVLACEKIRGSDKTSPPTPAQTPAPEKNASPSSGEGAQKAAEPAPPVDGNAGAATKDVVPAESCVSDCAPTPAAPADFREVCRSAFERDGISIPDAIPVKTLQVGVSVLGYGSEINDTETTEEPALTIVVATTVMSETKMKLLNRNAYYCLAANVGTMAKVTITRACSAPLASPDVDVQVGGESNVSGGTTVNVKSQIEELPCVD